MGAAYFETGSFGAALAGIALLSVILSGCLTEDSNPMASGQADEATAFRIDECFSNDSNGFSFRGCAVELRNGTLSETDPWTVSVPLNATGLRIVFSSESLGTGDVLVSLVTPDHSFLSRFVQGSWVSEPGHESNRWTPGVPGYVEGAYVFVADTCLISSVNVTVESSPEAELPELALWAFVPYRLEVPLGVEGSCRGQYTGQSPDLPPPV